MNLEEEKKFYENLWENILLDAMKGKFNRKIIYEVMKQLNEIDSKLFKIGKK